MNNNEKFKVKIPVIKNKKLIKNIVILIAVFALMVVAYIFVKKIPEKDGIIQEQTKSGYETIYSTEYENIVKISIANSNGNNVFIKENDKWLYQSDISVELSDDKMTILLNDLGTVVGNVIEKEPEDLSLYGFDEPSAEVEITLIDNSSQKFYLGSQTATASGYYFKKEGDNTVYILPEYKSSNFLKSIRDFIDSNVFSITSENVKSISVTNKKGSFKLNKTDESDVKATSMVISAWELVEPNKLAGNDEAIEKELFTNMQLIATEFYTNTEVNFKKYGLDTPVCSITYEMSDKSIKKVIFGKSENENIYMFIEGKNSIYQVSKSELNILDVSFLEMSSSLALLESIDNIKNVQIDIDDKRYLMSIERNGEEEKYSINNKSVKEEDFKKLYQKIIGVTIEGQVDTNGSGTHICTVTYNYVKDLKPKVVSFFTYQDRFASIVINDQLNYYTTKEQVQKIIDGVSSLAK